MADDANRVVALEAEVEALRLILERLTQAVGQLNLGTYMGHPSTPHIGGVKGLFDHQASFRSVDGEVDRIRTSLEEWKQ